MAIAMKFEDSLDCNLQSAVRRIGAEGMTSLNLLLLKHVLLKKDRTELIKYLRARGYASLIATDEQVHVMHQSAKESQKGADFLKALGFTNVFQLANYAQRTLQFNVCGPMDQSVGALQRANRTFTHLGFKFDCEDRNQRSRTLRGCYDEYTYQVLEGKTLKGFVVLRWYHGEITTRIELCPNTGS